MVIRISRGRLIVVVGCVVQHQAAVLASVRACGGAVALWARGVLAGRAPAAACRLSVWPAGEQQQAAALPLSHRLAVKLEGVLRAPAWTR